MVTTISGGIFDFTEGGYVPPTWSGAENYFISNANVHQIFSDNTHVYAVADTGLNIYDIVTEDLYAYIIYNDGFNTVWKNSSNIYVGTTNSGIKSVAMTTVSGGNLTQHLSTEYQSPKITSNNIKYIHGYNSSILICTNSGVDYISIENPQTFYSSTIVDNAYKCFLTSKAGYYTISGTEWSINKRNVLLTDWIEPNVSYVTGSGIFAEGISLNDIYITEGTSSNGTSNCIFCATSSGVYVIDEGAPGFEEYAVYTKQ